MKASLGPGRLGLALTAAIVLATSAGAEGPLAIHSPPLLVPEETAGSGLAPEAAVKISIDARGSVTAVDVISIVPSSEYDARFRERLVETLSSWRFAPATEDGHPKGSTLEWRVRFPARPEQLAMTVDATAPLAGGDAEQRRSAVLALPQEQRHRLLEAQARTALGVLDARRRKDASSPRFAVHTDADDPKVAGVVAGNLEAIFNVLAQELLRGVSLQPEPFKVQVFVYRDRAGYDALLREMPGYEQSEGFYSPAGMIALHLEQLSSDTIVTVLLHEATHAFLDRHVVRPGVALPRWLGEGFADYVGNSRVVDGRLRPGKTLRRKFELRGGAVLDLQTMAGARLDEAKEALRRGKGLGVRALLEASPQIFYGEQGTLYYASAWLLVHYLRDGGDGWSSDRFPQLLLYLAEGYPPGAAFRTIYGAPEAADDAFRKYVKAF